MTKPLTIAISGAGGRMGVALMKALAAHPSLKLTAAGIRPGTAALTRRHLEQAGISVADDVLVESAAELVSKADAVIDFSAPENAVALAALAGQHKKILVSGTTGLTAAQRDALVRAGEQARVIWSANMSVGVNLLAAMVEHTAKILGPETDIEILEMHHRHKVDAPSGTALALGEAAAKGRGVNLSDAGVRTRDGHTGPRKSGSIGFATLRGGDVIGDHTVMFAGMGERIELSHKASNRDIFARGALVAASWAADKPNGFYTMRDVVKL